MYVSCECIESDFFENFYCIFVCYNFDKPFSKTHIEPMNL